MTFMGLEGHDRRQLTPPRHSPGCPDPALLIAANDDALDDRTAQQIRTRVLERSTRSKRMRWGGAAATLATAAAVILLVIPRQDVPPLPPAGPSRASVPAVQRPTIFAAGRPDIPRPEPELTLRGDTARAPVGEQIGSALDLADAGLLSESLARLESVVREHPQSADAHLALGATLLRVNRIPEAIPLLEQARTLAGAQRSEEFDWFYAAALARSGDVGRAAGILEGLCRRNSTRGAMACAGLTELRRPRRTP